MNSAEMALIERITGALVALDLSQEVLGGIWLLVLESRLYEIPDEIVRRELSAMLAYAKAEEGR